jgi:rhamnosyltransferase subunit B
VHFICSTFGSSGDVFPMLGLALELRGRGHEVTFATNEHYAGLAAEHGLPFEPLGTREAFAACIRHPDLWHPQRAFGHVFRSLQPALKRQYEIHADARSVGITNCFGFGALMAQDKLRVPVITLHCQPSVIWSDVAPPDLAGVFGPRWLKSLMFRVGERLVLDPVVCPFLNAWRQELGLAPVGRIVRWWNSSYGVLCLFPEWYAPPQRDWPAGIMQTDFPLWNRNADAPLSVAVEAFLAAGAPPLVFTPGSTNLHGGPFFAAAIAACHALGRRGILLTEFPDQLPQPLPDAVAHFSYVPLDALLPRTAAFVHHGGIGSTSQAMLAGIPQVLMPLAHDQFDNGMRVKKLRVGDSIPAPRFTGARLTAALRRLLDSTHVAAACRELSQRLAKRDGLTRAADAVERRVAEAANSLR